MENPVGGSAAPTASPSSDIPRVSLRDLLNDSGRGVVGPITVEFRLDRPTMVYDEFGHIGYVDSEGFVVPMLVDVPVQVDWEARCRYLRTAIEEAEKMLGARRTGAARRDPAQRAGARAVNPQPNQGDLVMAQNVGLAWVVGLMDGMIGALRVVDLASVIVYPEQVLAVFRRAA